MQVFICFQMSINIIFDNPSKIFWAGQSISGKVEILLTEPKTIKKIVVDIEGLAHCSWRETSSETRDGKTEDVDVMFTGDHKYFDYRIILVEEPEKFKIPPGLHSYRFQYILPMEIPASIEGVHGHVRYTVKANIDIPWGLDITRTEQVTVVPYVDLNRINEAQQRFMIEKDKTVGILCCTSGKIVVTVTAPKSGFVIGETGIYEILIENSSNISIYETVIKLTKSTIFTSNFPHTERKITSSELHKTVFTDQVESRTNRTLTASILIPTTEPSTTDQNAIIMIKYKIQVCVKLSGAHFNMDMERPIVIGTTPLQGSGGDPTSVPFSQESPAVIQPNMMHTIMSQPTAPTEFSEAKIPNPSGRSDIGWVHS